MHASPQFTPAQLIDSGRRAEAEGRLDLAAQFYRHLADQFAETAEAAEARSSLGRIGAASADAWNAPRGGAAGAGSPWGAAHAQRRRPRRDHYPIGRALAVLLTVVGGLVVLAGVAALPIYALSGGAVLPWLGLLPMAGGAAGFVVVGCVVALAGHIARALFDQANATRDLLALERAKLGLD